MEGDNATYQEEVIVFERATRAMRGHLLKTAINYLHNAEEAEDAVQETLMRCWVARHRLHHIEEMPAFAMRILKNLCIEQLRGKKEISDYVTNDHIAPADIVMMKTLTDDETILGYLQMALTELEKMINRK